LSGEVSRSGSAPHFSQLPRRRSMSCARSNLHAEPESSLLDSQMKDHLSVLLQLVGADSIDDDRPH